MLIAAAAVAVVGFASSARNLQPVATNSSCGDHLFVLDGDSLWDVDAMAHTTSNQRQFRPSSPGFGAFWVDLAYDGRWWGVVLPAGSSQSWGRIDPDQVSDGTNTPGMMVAGQLPFSDFLNLESATRPAFLREAPEPGSPIGYRFSGRPPDTTNCPHASGDTTGAGRCALDLYAVDSLSPFREHLVAANIGPNRFNFGLGTTVYVSPGAGSQESRTNVFFTTTDSVYCYGAGPLCPASVTNGLVQQTGFLSLYRISRNAVISGSAQPNLQYIADGGALFSFDFETGDVYSGLVSPLSQIVGASYYACRRGGVQFEPDTRIYTSEAGGSSTFTVALTYAPTADVTMALTSSNAAEGTVSPSSVTFTAADWNVPHTVTVTGVADAVVDGPQDYTIVTGDLVSTDANYSGMVIRDLAATNHDGGGPSLTLHSPITIQQGAQFTAPVADVFDAEDPAGSLTLTLGTNFHAVTLGPLTNTNGAVTAPVSAPCGTATYYGRFWSIDVADSAGNHRSDQVEVDVTAAGSPLLAYPASTTVLSGASGQIAPTSFDGSADPITVSAPTFTGTITADVATGQLSVTNAGPPGNHTVEVTATHRCTSTQTVASFTLHVNAPPSLTPGTPSIAQGTISQTTTLATVSDAETAAGSLTVAPVSMPAGITLGTITNSGGTITAPVTAACSAVSGNLTLRVTDANGASTDTDVAITVTPNTSPLLGTYPLLALNQGSGGVSIPTSVPSDNGGITLSAAAAGFTGTISANPSTGGVTIANAGPPGAFTVVVTATDNCGATATRSFALNVNGPPSIAGGSAARQQGTTASAATIATVSDAEDAAGSLAVTATSVPAGITVTSITNSNGTITATVGASCSAAVGANVVTLQVTDSAGLTATATFTVNVSANTPPALGTYAGVSIPGGGSAVVSPSVPVSDNGTASMSVSAPGLTGTLSIDAAGNVTIGNAGPSGSFTITVTATDNCGASSTSAFVLTVTCATAISPVSVNLASAASSGSVTVDSTTGCDWTATAPQGAFVTITGGASGSGNGTVSYSVAQNTTGTARSTVLTIAGNSFTVTQSASGVPTFAMTATASSSNVSVVWGAVTGATSYEVRRSSGGGAFIPVTTTAGLSFPDGTVSPGTGYLYRVEAISAAGTIAYSNIDLAVPFAYSAATPSLIRAADFLELRQAANAARAALGWPSITFSRAIAPGVVAQAADLTTLRAAVSQVRAAIGATPLSYTDPTITPQSTPIRAVHVVQLRDGLK